MLYKIRSLHAFLQAAALVFTTQLAFYTDWVEASSSTYYLEGIGYRE